MAYPHQLKFGRHQKFPALCGQLLACLREYETWLLDFEQQTADWRFREAIRQCREMIKDVEGWDFHNE